MTWQQLAAYVFHTEFSQEEAQQLASRCAEVLVPTWKRCALDPFQALRTAVNTIYSDEHTVESRRLASWVLLTCAQEADEIEMKMAA